jgi:hypothetical protein
LEEDKMMNGAFANSDDFSTLDQLDNYGRSISAKTLHLEESDLDKDFELSLLVDWKIYQYQKEELSERPKTLSENEVSRFIVLAASSPFESIDELRIWETDSEAQEAISNFRALKLGFRERLFARLQFLFECSKEEDPEQIAISPPSLNDFLAFLESLATYDLAYPDIVLSPAKNIRAQWQSGMNKHVVIEFLGNKRVQFVIFRPDSNDARNPIRLSGLSSVESLIREIVMPNKVDWIFK